ncbi:tryptophan 2,3-dioxygenase family protein [Streptomyces sp. NPDC054883]
MRAAVTRWRTRHLLLVERMIGDEPGTGGTSGLAHLRARIYLSSRSVGGPD